MPRRIVISAAVWLVAATVTWAASVDRAQELYLSGNLDSARGELQALLADGDASQRAAALALLGRIEVDRRDWQAALDAWGELADQHALSPEAAAIMPAIRPLQALVECGCAVEPEPAPVTAGTGPPASGPPASTPGATSTPAPPPTTTAAAVAPPPAPTVAPAAGLLLIGGWGAEYDAAVEATAAVAEFLEANGVGVRAASTAIPAIHGEDTVLEFLLEEARASNADGVLFLTSRFNFREYIHMRRFDADGRELWGDRMSGSTALKERRDRDKPNWSLVERFKKRLSKRLSTPDLPTG